MPLSGSKCAAALRRGCEPLALGGKAASAAASTVTGKKKKKKKRKDREMLFLLVQVLPCVTALQLQLRPELTNERPL